MALRLLSTALVVNRVPHVQCVQDVVAFFT